MPAERSCHAEHSCCASASAVPTANLQPHERSVLSRIRIVQMDCPTEERLLREVLEARPEVLELHFNLLQRVLTVRHQPHSLDAVLAGIDSLGFTPQLLGDEPAPAAPQRPWWPLAVAGALALGAEVRRTRKLTTLPCSSVKRTGGAWSSTPAASSSMFWMLTSRVSAAVRAS